MSSLPERRLRAAKLAGMQKIPALVRNVSDQESMVLAWWKTCSGMT